MSKVIADSRDPLNLYVEVRQTMKALYMKTFDYDLLKTDGNAMIGELCFI